MKRYWPLLASFGVVLSFLGLSTALAEGTWTLISSPDGLLRPAIHCLTPTASGGMLVGTSHGLSYWDGRRWVSYGSDNGVPDGYITALAEDQAGTIWVGSWGGGLGCLQDGSWRRYRAADSPLPGDWVTALVSDREGLWIAAYGRGLAYLKESVWTTFTRANSLLPSERLTCLLADKAGGVWIGTERSGLVHYDGRGHWRVYKVPGDEQEVTALAWRGHQLWVGTRRGVAVLEPESEVWHKLSPGQGLPEGRVTALAAMPDGRMWIGMDRGLALWGEGRVRVFTVQDGLPHNYVSALAIDTQGRLWVGSYVRGLAVQGELVQPKVARVPVVLVHGWRGPESDLLEDSEFWHMARWLREDGFEPYYATGISPRKTLQTNAVRLREFIAQVCRESGAKGVYLIAFSMGGLNARAYLESTLYQGDVLRAFILGTPHRGEEIWLPFLLWEYLAWTDEPSALELLPVYAELFNRCYDNAWGVPYTVVAGDVRESTLPTLFRELAPSDGLVSTWSALGITGTAVDRRVTGDVHAWSNETILMGIPSLLFPRRTYDAHIRPYLFGTADAPGMGSLLSAHDYQHPPVTEPMSALRTGSVELGGKVSLEPIPIEASSRVRFYVRWKGGPLKVSVRDPLGRVIDSQRAESDKESEYLELGFADFASYVLTDTLAGLWTIMLESDPKNSGPSHYVAYASISSTVRLEVRTDRAWYRPGETAIISATLVASGAPAVLNEVQVDVYSPSKRPVSLHLTPVSVGTTTGAATTYVGHYHVPLESGYYVLLAQAKGTYGQAQLERGAAFAFGVCGDGARLSGLYSLAPRRDGAMSGADDLEAVVGVVAQREGDYLCSITLADEVGHRVTTVAHPVHLVTGTHALRIPIPAWAATVAHQGGSYRLGEVILVDVSDVAVLLDAATDVWLASPFNLRDETHRR